MATVPGGWQSRGDRRKRVPILANERAMRNLPALFLLIVAIIACRAISTRGAEAQHRGAALFEEHCSLCHTIGGGDLVGPDLAGVEKRRPREWLLRFIESPEEVREGGDSYAAALFSRYGEAGMPESGLSEEEIGSILAYIAAKGTSNDRAEEPTLADSAVAPSVDATRAAITYGKELFQGVRALRSSGAPCNSCHNVRARDYLAGGSLAKDLTDAYGRLGEKALRAIIKSPPFPAMRAAYEDHPISEQEVSALTAFLQETAEEGTGDPGVSYPARFVLPGLGGAFALMLLFGALWMRTKRDTVNRAVFKRQLRSR